MTLAARPQSDIHALNAVCPYFTMFPIEFPLAVLATGERGLVVDPFCGRGTTNLAARFSGSPTIGFDTSAVAVAATKAKITKRRISPDEIVEFANNLLREFRAADVPKGRFWGSAYHPKTLEQICSIRTGLLATRKRDVAWALRGVMLGGLHGPIRKTGGSSYLSNQAPRTFSPKPHYALAFWERNQLRPPKVNVIEVISQRAKRAFACQLKPVPSHATLRDSRKVDWEWLVDRFGPIRWVITSPPYYGLRTYRPDQWLREWFLGGDPIVDYSAKGQLRHSTLTDFTTDLSMVWKALAAAADRQAQMVIRFGSINDRPIDAPSVALDSLRDTGWRVVKIRSAGYATAGRRQAVSFSTTSHPPVEEIDIWCQRQR